MTNDQMNSLVESSAESLEKLRVLTQQDIDNSAKLTAMQMKAGDTYNPQTKELNRVNSTDPEGRLLTIEDISNSRRLQEIGAEVGDVWADGQVLKSDDSPDSLVRQFEYGFKKTGNVLTNFADFLESRVPLGRLVIGGDSFISINRLPEEIQSLEPDAILGRIKEARIEALDAEFGPNFNAGGSAAETAGSISKLLLDPVNALYAGRTVAGATGMGFGYGAVDSALQQKVDGQEIDYGQVAQQAGLTAFAAGAITKGVKAIQERPSAMTKKQKMFQEAVNMKTATGMKQFDALDKTAKEFGMNQAEVAKMVSITGNKITLGASGLGREAEQMFDTALVYDTAAASVQSSAIKDAVLSINNRLDAIHPELGGGMRKHEAFEHVDTQARLAEIEPFAGALERSLSRSELEEVTRLMYNQRFDLAEKIVRRRAPDALPEFGRMQKQLKKNAQDLIASGNKDLKVIKNYAPRSIANVEGLVEELGKSTKNRNKLEKMMTIKANQTGKNVEDLDEIERASVLDKFMRGYEPDGANTYKLASEFERGLDEIPKNLMKYYHPITTSLRLNARSVSNEVAKRKFFGKNQVNNADGSLNAELSIGGITDSLVQRGEIDDAGLNYAQKLFRARFVGGEKTGNKLQQKVREAGFLGTIANPLSALTQLTDLAMTFHKNGILNSLGTLAKAAVGKSKIKQTQAGIDAGNKELQEIMENGGAMTFMLEKGFSLSGFKALDRIMKETYINASFNKMTKLAQTKKGQAQLSRKYAPIFRDEWPIVLNDLKEGNQTTSVFELLFSSLAEVQPISRAEMPATYNANPNYRWMYMLKSFMLKQMDVAKRDVYDNLRSGDAKRVAEGVKNGVVLGSLYGSLGAGVAGLKDWIRGKEVYPDGIANEALWSVGGVYSLNEYLVRDLKQGNLTDAAASFITPPLALFETIYKTLLSAAEEGVADEKTLKAFSRMPVFGAPVYFVASDESPVFGDY